MQAEEDRVPAECTPWNSYSTSEQAARCIQSLHLGSVLASRLEVNPEATCDGLAEGLRGTNTRSADSIYIP